MQIKPGQTATAVGQRLAALGVVASARAFSNAAKASAKGNTLEPGYYRVHKHMKAALALALLLKPVVAGPGQGDHPGGLAAVPDHRPLGRATGNPRATSRPSSTRPRWACRPSPTASPRGTCSRPPTTSSPGTSPTSVLKTMVQRFNQEAASINLPAAAAQRRS